MDLATAASLDSIVTALETENLLRAPVLRETLREIADYEGATSIRFELSSLLEAEESGALTDAEYLASLTRIRHIIREEELPQAA